MDKPRRRPRHLQLVHSEPASSAPLAPPPRRWQHVNRLAVALGVFVLGLLIWTRASDMPESATATAEPMPAPTAADIGQNFPSEPAAATRHISAVLAFDAARVREPGAREPTEFLEPGAHVEAGSRLSFRLYNRSPQSAYFVIFGVTGAGVFTWLYPPDQNTGVNRSLPLAPVPRVELPEPMTLPADVSDFTLVGVFTDAPVTTTEIKQTWQAGGAMALQGTLHAQVQTLPVNAHQP